MQRIKIEEIRKDPWFKRNYIPSKPKDETVNLDDVRAVFEDIEVRHECSSSLGFISFSGKTKNKKDSSVLVIIGSIFSPNFKTYNILQSETSTGIILLKWLMLQEKYVNENPKSPEVRPLAMNAFEMITLSQGLNLSALFDRQQVCHWI